MKVEMKKFGDLLISRPAGREAFLAFRAYSKPSNATETIELDFAGVAVLAPSWADEFVSALRETFSNPVMFIPSENPSVTESLKMLSF